MCVCVNVEEANSDVIYLSPTVTETRTHANRTVNTVLFRTCVVLMILIRCRRIVCKEVDTCELYIWLQKS